ncbi:MATE family efflux transporter [Alkalilimnicola ehrlichii MLHE-1]|uniref:MATE efflux family protein n=1 Tax=Alkalilimnicola ehrlichii (strain ATCC BAA-1101 / DSM 17681 / MLHE-1) TaxID=187272 RepID=Q0A852_ALKEH|nr:MATE family efflux transporter [Alkalilimnicola ehrlichii]ABI56985.1 MATE efflux family protein [Alkalilimnicola ehrlichii MLHE-1]
MTTEEMLRAGLGRTLFRMTWPMLFGVLALMSYQLVDSVFISYLGVEPLAALGFTLPVQQVIIGVQVGLGIATTAVISRSLGAAHQERARQLGGLVIMGGAGLMALLALLLWGVRYPLVGLMGAGPELLPLIDAYWGPWLLATWLGAQLYFGYSVCRAHGDTRLPGLLMVISSLINVALDPLFIFVFGWGLPGAAWATVVAFGVSLGIVHWALRRQDRLRFRPRGLSPLRALRDLGGITGPATASQLLPPVSAMAATALVAGFGSAAVGAWAIATRLEFFSIVAVLALTMALPPMVGRFRGAGDPDSIRRLVHIAVTFVLVWQLGVAVVWLVLSFFLPELISREPEVAGLLTDYLRLAPWSYAALGVCMLMVSVCNALGMPLRALVIALLRLFVCYLPALWVGARLGGMTGLFLGVLVGNLLAGLAAWSLYRQGLAWLQAPPPETGRGESVPVTTGPSQPRRYWPGR